MQKHISNYALELYDLQPVLSIEKTGEVGVACDDYRKMEFYEWVLDNYVIQDIYHDLKRISRGEKPYKTEDSLFIDGNKADGMVEYWFSGPIMFYDITIDRDVERTISSLVHTYVHERLHPEYHFEDSDAMVEYLTGMALYKLMHVKDEDVSSLASRGYQSFLERQNRLKTSLDSDWIDIYSFYCESDIKNLYTQE